MAARIGVPTASQFHRIISPVKQKPSDAQDSYLDELLAEWFLGQPLDTELSQFMERGQDLEQQAIAFYEAQRDTDITPVGFILHDDGIAGCSPDGLVGEDGGFELKCPSPATHMGYLRASLSPPEPNKYYCQVQGALWITGRAWWDFESYHPTLPPALMHYERDDLFIAKLGHEVERFAMRLDEEKQRLIDRGYHPPDERVAGWLKTWLERALAETAHV
jgi:hypothetical protein